MHKKLTIVMFATLLLASCDEAAKQEMNKKVDKIATKTQTDKDGKTLEITLNNTTNKASVLFNGDAKQAEKDAKQAEKDVKQAGKDAKQAGKDAKQAGKDAKRAGKDAKQAEKDAKQAEKDAKQAEKDAKQAENDAKQAENDAKQAKKMTQNRPRKNV
jgi:hypothetical protein